MKNRLICLLAAASLATPAVASNYNYTPESMRAELNGFEWEDPSTKVYFSSLRNCSQDYKIGFSPENKLVYDRMVEEEKRLYDAYDSVFNNKALARQRYNEFKEYQVMTKAVWDSYRNVKTITGYRCYAGWVTIKNPQGTHVCEVDQVGIYKGNWKYKATNCVLK